MTLRQRFFMAAVAGVLAVQASSGQEPPRLGLEAARPLTPRPEPSANQQVANAIAALLGQSAALRGYTIDISYLGGTATLTGRLIDPAQRDEVLRLVQGVPGVERVRDLLAVGAITQVQAPAGEPVPPPAGAGELVPPPGSPTLIPPPSGAMLPPSAGAPLPTRGGGMVEPMPIYQAGPPSGYDLNPPFMPPYAWPTYAPYNNFSRVAYPEQYPAQAWPFIGPFNPFPKVPLGWRKVQLEWEDGHWWYSKAATPHDWWRVRYW